MTEPQSKYKFTRDWFSANNAQPLFKAIFEKILAKTSSPKVLEIGTYEGRSAIFTLENLPNSELHCVDTFEGSNVHTNEEREGVWDRFMHNCAEFIKEGRLNVHRGDSKFVLADLLVSEGLREFFDMIYVDGDHSASGVMHDLVQSWMLLKSGGFLICDDYIWEVSIKIDNTPSPVPLLHQMPFGAITFFMQMYWGQFEIVYMSHQFALRKL